MTNKNVCFLSARVICAMTSVVAMFLASTCFGQGVSFRKQVQPLLANRCLACHGPDENAREADLRLDTEAGAKASAIEPGNADDSELIVRIESDDPDLAMPPAGHGKRLTSDEQKLLRDWINQGAPWQGHWAFEPISRPDVPVDNSGWSKGEIDKFVLRRMKAAGLKQATRADDRTFIRRVYLDLIGIPPQPDQVEQFLNDSSSDRFDKVVDQLLKSRHYGEQMAVAWLDVARFADTNGYQNDFVRSMWVWRDWVIDAYNQNMPYDQFIIEQIAGDMLPQPTTSQLIASGFNRNNPTVTEGGAIDEEWRIENCVDRTETTAAAFLGLTVGCGRCHDHKYDPISKKEFYEFFAFFNNIDEKGVYTERRGNSPPLIHTPTPEQVAALSKVDKETEALSEEDPAKAELAARRKKLIASQQTTMVMRERNGEYRPTWELNRGQYDQPKKDVDLWPGVPAALPQLADDQPKNRLGLARWLVDDRNPLVARVIVNRAWLKFFGRGLVDPPDNFGVQGAPPSHPELLDWLADDFRSHGWDLKRLHRQIVLSATYQQASEATATKIQVDRENRWFSRGPRYRLSAEQIRDSALLISGLLNTEIGGPSVFPYQPDGLWDELAGGANNGPYKQSSGRDLYRRSLYTYRKRTVPHPTTSTFDAPSWEKCQIKRANTNTPLQALALLNDTTYVEAAKKFAERILNEGGQKIDEHIDFAMLAAKSRPPTELERATLKHGFSYYLEFYQEHPNEAKKLLANGESTTDESRSAEMAAMTSVASVILNLDKTMTKE